MAPSLQSFASLPAPPTNLGHWEVLVVRKEKWQLCGSVALDPKDGKWSCCKGFYPFHRPTQRCCQTWGKFIIIPMDPEKSEAEDCRTHTQKTLGPLPSVEGFVCFQTGRLCQ
ncbi:hypothetical protein CB1_000420005 [Camelus ferus]|nr:hypothetical protein CB1_000420005 [Camelus ferus]